MAIYHATTKPISRSSGRSATASAAYRAGVEILDERTGLKHDYSQRNGVVLSLAFDKNENILDRSKLWNKAEKAENRRDGRTAREWILAIPHELVPIKESDQKNIGRNEGAKAVFAFAKLLAERYDVAVDVAIHSPDKAGDNRNWHAHILTTTRKFELNEQGFILGSKADIELSNTKRKERGLASSSFEIKDLRKEWAYIANQFLKQYGSNERIDHRSLKDQGIERQPTIKLGWQASAMERRGKVSERGDINRRIKSYNEQLKALDLEIYILEGRRQAQQKRQALLEINAGQPTTEDNSTIIGRYAQWKEQKEQGEFKKTDLKELNIEKLATEPGLSS